MEQKQFSFSEACNNLHLDDSRIRYWVEKELVVPSGSGGQEYFEEADLDRMRVIRNLMDDLEVNEEGVEVILGMRDRMIAMEKWMRAVFTIMDEHQLLDDSLIKEFKKFI